MGLFGVFSYGQIIMDYWRRIKKGIKKGSSLTVVIIDTLVTTVTNITHVNGYYLGSDQNSQIKNDQAKIFLVQKGPKSRTQANIENLFSLLEAIYVGECNCHPSIQASPQASLSLVGGLTPAGLGPMRGREAGERQ